MDNYNDVFGQTIAENTVHSANKRNILLMGEKIYKVRLLLYSNVWVTRRNTTIIYRIQRKLLNLPSKVTVILVSGYVM